MSRTYNQSAHDFDKYSSDIEYPNGYVGRYGRDLKPGEITPTDWSGTTAMEHPHEKCVRHPNKKKKTNSLGREFTDTGITGTRYWRNRFGEEDEKSSRYRLVKRELTQKRRNRLKNQTREMIDEQINEG